MKYMNKSIEELHELIKKGEVTSDELVKESLELSHEIQKKFGSFLFKKEAMGGADVKLMFIVGLCLEPFLALLVIIIASMIALPISLVLLVKEKEHAIPFGPFILIGLLVVFFTKLNSAEIIKFLIGKYYRL